eukprot:2009246-Prymnesium_polylepis.1
MPVVSCIDGSVAASPEMRYFGVRRRPSSCVSLRPSRPLPTAARTDVPGLLSTRSSMRWKVSSMSGSHVEALFQLLPLLHRAKNAR